MKMIVLFISLVLVTFAHAAENNDYSGKRVLDYSKSDMVDILSKAKDGNVDSQMEMCKRNFLEEKKSKAIEWCQRASEQGHEEALFFLKMINQSEPANDVAYSSTDEKRIDGVLQLVDSLKRYENKMGYALFSNSPMSRPDLQFIVVHITDKDLKGDDLYPPHGITGTRISTQGLLREFDRQNVGVKITYDTREFNPEDVCQKYYMYHWDGYEGCYSVSINLEKPHKYSREISKNCHAYVVSSCEVVPSYTFMRLKPKQ